jgi:glycosyltransferase involved in cell wall biosynthesis
MSTEPGKNLNNFPTFLYVGGDSYIKGFYILLYALEKMKDENVMAKLLLVGNYSRESRELLRKIGRGKNMVLNIVGPVSHEKVIRLHRESWALLFPSLVEEPLPYAVVEASLLGTIPIASKIGGVQETLQGTPAEKYMFDPRDVEQLTNKTKAVIDSGVDDIAREGMVLRRALLSFFGESDDKSLKRLVKVFSSG